MPTFDSATADSPISPKPKKPKRNNNKNSNNQPCDLSVILHKLNSIESSVKSVEEKVQDVVKSNEEVKKSIAELKKEFETRTTDHETRISNVEELAVNLQSTISQIKTNNEVIYNEMNKLNLVLVGLPDSEGETNSQLVKSVTQLVQGITKSKIAIDIASRLGKFRSGSSRAVKIKFVTMFERNCAYFHRTSLRHPCFINEDLSPETRKDLAILRLKKKEILSSDRSAPVTIDSRTKTLHHGNTRISIQNGIMRTHHHRRSPNKDSENMDFQTSQSPRTFT